MNVLQNNNLKLLFEMNRKRKIDSKKPIHNNHWSSGLLDSMKNPDLKVKETEKFVVIKDKYPKAKIHYLVLPHEDISSLTKLNKSHISLLEEFNNQFEEFKTLHPNSCLRAGFHAIPSMQRLHMHIISSDMISQCLKTKNHWNSFTTAFFIPIYDILEQLKENGQINSISKESHKELMGRSPLKCNQCSYVPKNMPNLKEHLLTHDK